MNPASSMTSSATAVAVTTSTAVAPTAANTTTSAISNPKGIVIPNQLPTPSQKACQVAFATFAEAIVIGYEKPQPDVAILMTEEEQKQAISNQLLYDIYYRSYSHPFRNYLAHTFDVVSGEPLPQSMRLGTPEADEHITNTAITRFCHHVNAVNHRETNESIRKTTMERMVSVWKGYYDASSFTQLFTSLAQDMFRVGENAHVPQLGQIIIEYVVDFTFKHKLLIAKEISAMPITVDQATQQVLSQLDEANAKLKDTPSASASESSSTAVVLTTQPNRADIVRAHISQIFEYKALKMFKNTEVSVAYKLMKESMKNKAVIKRMQPKTAIPKIEFYDSVIRRIGSTFPTNEEITDAVYGFSVSD